MLAQPWQDLSPALAACLAEMVVHLAAAVDSLGRKWRPRSHPCRLAMYGARQSGRCRRSGHRKPAQNVSRVAGQVLALGSVAEVSEAVACHLVHPAGVGCASGLVSEGLGQVGLP